MSQDPVTRMWRGIDGGCGAPAPVWHAYTRAMPLQALRLEPGDDLRRALEAICMREGASGFVVAGIGSLTDARLRLAAADEETPIPGPSELVSLAGSLSPEGAHLHAVVADAQGRVVGGHVPAGCVVRTTAELLVAWLPAGSLSREVDARTGFKELVVRKAGQA